VPEFKTGRPAHQASLNHEHSCYPGPEHGGLHACFCGVWWDDDGRIKLRRLPKRRRWGL